MGLHCFIRNFFAVASTADSHFMLVIMCIIGFTFLRSVDYACSCPPKFPNSEKERMSNTYIKDLLFHDKHQREIDGHIESYSMIQFGLHFGLNLIQYDLETA